MNAAYHCTIRYKFDDRRTPATAQHAIYRVAAPGPNGHSATCTFAHTRHFTYAGSLLPSYLCVCRTIIVRSNPIVLQIITPYVAIYGLS